MPTITIDGKKVECRDGVPVLQAALEAGWDVPHYCYHPGLTVVASCRLCLMEQKLPDPKTKELTWSPKLLPSCQTPVKDGMEVRFSSPGVAASQKHVMEYYLLNHPLDCPVCDKAGECYLQDYAEDYGSASSRMIEEKHKNPKKDIGSHTLLYQDRCVLCTRCVRFCDEVAGPGELTVVDRGYRSEIDVFPGVPLENELQGNVVDLCPVGALLDKDFLFKQRVWLLEATPSVCPGCARGCTIHVDQNEFGVHRLRPRYNEKVNEWWMCDEGRFGWHYIRREDRLTTPQVREEDGTLAPARWEELAAKVRALLAPAAAHDQGSAIAAVLSPMMSCEEAWLLGRFVRSIAPQAMLVNGLVPVVGRDQTFRKGFTIKAEKCPNRRGVERVIEGLGGRWMTFDAFLAEASGGRYQAAYVTGGYPVEWVSDGVRAALGGVPRLILQDLFPSSLEQVAAAVIPSAPWTEREGSFMNCDGLVQPLERVVPPRDGLKPDGQFLFELAGESGLYRGRRVRDKMAQSMPEFGQVFTPRPLPVNAH